MVYRELTFNTYGLPGDSGNATFRLPEPIYVSRFRILSFTVPIIEFSIDDTCNVVKIADVDGSNVKTVIIPPGSYSSGNIVPTLEKAINDVAGQRYTVTYSDPQRSLTISAPAAFRILGRKQGSSAYQILGLPKDGIVGPGTSLQMPYQIDLNVCKAMLLTSRALRSRYSLYVNQPGLNTLACVTSDLGSDYAYVGGLGDGWLWAQQTISEIDFKVVDATTLRPINGLASLGFIVTMAVLDDDVLDAAQ